MRDSICSCQASSVAGSIIRHCEALVWSHSLAGPIRSTAINRLCCVKTLERTGLLACVFMAAVQRVLRQWLPHSMAPCFNCPLLQWPLAFTHFSNALASPVSLDWTQDLEEGQKLDVPLWLAETLSEKNFVLVFLPRNLSSKVGPPKYHQPTHCAHTSTPTPTAPIRCRSVVLPTTYLPSFSALPPGAGVASGRPRFSQATGQVAALL